MDLYNYFEKEIDDLYTFRDKYYILNEAPKSLDDRNRDLLDKLNLLTKELEEKSDKFDSKTSFLVLIGKAYNVLPEYSQFACDSLKKAIKLDSKCIDAWNYLGEVH